MSRTTPKFARAAAALLCALAACAWPARTATAQDATPRLRLAPCRLPGWSEDVRCGTYEVYENRRAKAGRKIALRVVVLPALSDHPAADPVFYFAGGPGASAVDTIAKAGPSYLAALRRDRDVVFVDQRGTGESNPLVCDLYGDKADMRSFFDAPFPVERLRACRAELEKRADLKFYSTEIAMDDLDEVRAALGYETINLYGGSYGSTAALSYLRQYPKRVRTATVLGVAPPDMKLPLPISKGVENALAKLSDDCAADPKCHAAFPDPTADVAAALAILDKGPVAVDAVNPFTGRPQTVTLTRRAFVDLVRIMLYQPDSTRWLPVALHRSARGEFGLFVTVGYQVFRGIEDLIARGMHFSVTCGEDVPFIGDAEAKSATAGTVYGDSRLRAYREVCAIWPRADVPASFATPVTSDAPVLLIAGAADPVAPPWLAEAAARHLPNSRLVVVPHTGHAFAYPCVDGLVAAFVAKGSVAGLDASCVEAVRRPPFLTEAMLTAAEKPKGAVEEVWEGVLDVGSAKLRLVLRLAKAPDGTLTAAVDSPDQGATGLAVDVVEWKGRALHFEMNLIGASYDGTLSADGNEIAGTWQQGVHTWPLNFKRAK